MLNRIVGVATSFICIAVVNAASIAQVRPDGTPIAADKSSTQSSGEPSSVQPRLSKDVLIGQIRDKLKQSHRPLRTEMFFQTHTDIATLIHELRTQFPEDPHVALYLPERWLSLKYLVRHQLALGPGIADPMDRLYAEIDEVLKTTNDSKLRSDALWYQTLFKLNEPIDGPSAFSLAESFVTQWPKDNRAAELLHVASMKLNSAWQLRVAFCLLCLITAAIVGIAILKPESTTKKWLMFGIKLGILATALAVILRLAFPNLSGIKYLESIGSEFLRSGYYALVSLIFEANPLSLLNSLRFWILILLASAITAGIGRWQRSRSPVGQTESSARRLLLRLTVVLAVCFAVDGLLVSRLLAKANRSIAGDYPDSFRGRLALGKTRSHEQIGQTFDLEFKDAISGADVSVQKMRGKVVVVIFWATWCGPCIHEIPELKRLYTEYHDSGVEFIGVSHDLPESEGGLQDLKSFVEKEQVPWPQYYQGHDKGNLLSGSAQDDFSESWGIDGVPTIFLIDPSGKLYSTEARGRLNTLIPRLLSAQRLLVE